MNNLVKLITFMTISIGIILLFIKYNVSTSNKPSTHHLMKPDGFSVDGHCIVKTTIQRTVGLSRFKHEREFIEHCKGKMIFVFPSAECRTFQSYTMSFPILINDGRKSELFEINTTKTVCSKQITEEVIREHN